MKKKRIGILNGGGDVPGLNAVIASIVKTAHNHNFDCVGFLKSYEGLLDDNCDIPLNLKNVWEITGRGGTILKSVNKGRFSGKIGSGDLNAIDPMIINLAKNNLKKLEIDTLIVIGGDGTLSSAIQLQKAGVNIVGVPKTIDNDIRETDMTFGFSTAVDIIVDLIDKLRTTASSHDRVFLVETMGRHTGWLALYGGLAAEADMILIPEIKFNYASIISSIKENKKQGKHYQIIVVAEGAQVDGNKVYREKMEKQESLFGGITNLITHEIGEELGEDFELRNMIIGHVQRGGSPVSYDRILSQRFGEAAVKAVVDNEYGKMVALKGNKIELVNLKKAVESLKLIELDNEIVQTCRGLGISFGD
jgi:6-phosphofructokinase